jgi:hypothetical protein
VTVALLEQRPGNVTTLVLTVPALARQWACCTEI